MTTNPNRFFYGFSLNYGNSSSHFRHFIIETVHDLNDYNGDTFIERVSRMEDYYFNEERVGEPYYVVYGSLKIDFKESSKFVASFESLNQAINLVEHLTGNPVTETDLPVYRPSDEN
jgi:hypothetical protein